MFFLHLRPIFFLYIFDIFFACTGGYDFHSPHVSLQLAARPFSFLLPSGVLITLPPLRPLIFEQAVRAFFCDEFPLSMRFPLLGVSPVVPDCIDR